MESPPVTIVGAGIAGLTCALELHRAGVASTVLEASNDIGGRVRTDRHTTDHGDYLLDRGFQIYLDAYPEGRRYLDLRALHLGAFAPAADVFINGAWSRIGDPRRRPTDAARAVLSRLASPRDILPLATLIALAKRAGPDPERTPDEPAIDLLRRIGVSDHLIDRVFKPFFGGVFFDTDLRTSARSLVFTLDCFGSGKAALPRGGMSAIPAQLAAELPEGTVHRGTPADEVTATSVAARDGRTFESEAVVLATNGASDAEAEPAWKSTATIWFSASEAPPSPTILKLDAEPDGPINHLAVVSAAQPAYAPEGRSLIAANTARAPHPDDGVFIAAARAQIRRWFGDVAGTWETLRVDRVHRALPAQEGGRLTPWRRPPERADGVFVCGDSLADGSINGAMASGRRAALAVIARLGAGAPTERAGQAIT